MKEGCLHRWNTSKVREDGKLVVVKFCTKCGKTKRFQAKG